MEQGVPGCCPKGPVFVALAVTRLTHMGDATAITVGAPGLTASETTAAIEPAVRLRGVRKTYGDVVAVENLSLEVPAGHFFTMLGPSGSGKTTTLRVIAGFEPADAGTVQLHGIDVTTMPPYARPVNTVFQDYALFPHCLLYTSDAADE